MSDYARLDKGYQAVRVDAKPKLRWPAEAADGQPVYGMFRDDRETLAHDLADFIHAVFRGKGFRLPDGTKVTPKPGEGDLGDCALLCSSPREQSNGGTTRLPGLLRDELESRRPAIQVFNPRGQVLTEIPVVARLGGLILQCLDPDGGLEAEIRGLPRDVRDTTAAWREEAVAFMREKKAPAGLRQYVEGWGRRNPGRPDRVWPRSVPVLHLIYGLRHFFPFFQDDPEGQVYLEVFTRQVTACEQVGKFSAQVVHDPAKPELSRKSLVELVRNFIAPIASGSTKVNEELVDTFPRNRLNVLSVHQAKGLEFPLTIVDVGSDFRTNHPSQAFKRFPVREDLPHRLEELVRPFSPIDTDQRPPLDRCFDDLFRHFFVAFSRAEQILLLVGLRKAAPGGVIANVAAGWDRGGNDRWAAGHPVVEL